MAQTPVVEDFYDGDGVTRVFQLTWPYQEASEVFVSVNDVDVPYVFLSGSTSNVQTLTAPVAGSKVRVYRNTKAITPKHLFTGGVPFLPRYVDENNKQQLYALQEGLQDFQKASDNASTAIELATAAEAQASDALERVILEEVARQNGDANLQAQLTGNVPLAASAFSVISWHSNRLSNSVAIPDNVNAWSFGPELFLDPGVSVTVGAGSSWTIADGAESGPVVIDSDYGEL